MAADQLELQVAMEASQVDVLLATEERLNWDYNGWAHRSHAPALKKSVSLLCSMLSKRQLSDLKRRNHFTMVLANGHRYRFWPDRATVARVKFHQGRWLKTIEFCIHPEYRLVPPPDITIQHLLLLAESEKTFLEVANHSPAYWYENWLSKRRMYYDTHHKRVMPWRTRRYI